MQRSARLWSDAVDDAAANRCRSTTTSHDFTFWIVVYATVIANAYEMVRLLLPTASYGDATFFLGLVFAQISMSAIWAVFATGTWWRLMAPFIAALLSAFVNPETGVAFGGAAVHFDLFLASLLSFNLQAVCVLATLLLVRPMFVPGRWRFSLAHILAAITVIAVLLALARVASLAAEEWLAMSVLVAVSTALALYALFVCSPRKHRLGSLVVLLAVALAIGWLLEVAGPFDWDFQWLTFCSVQALMLWAWIRGGGVGLAVREEQDG